VADSHCSWDGLIREVREVPSPEVRLDALAAVLGIIENQIDSARYAAVLKLRDRHELESIHPEDAEIDRYELEEQLTHVLPKTLRGGFVLALWSTLESCTRDLAHYASKHLDQQFPTSLSSGGFVEGSDKAFRALFGFDACQSPEEREALKRLAKIRNALVHHNANITELPSDLKGGDVRKMEAEGLYKERDLHHEYFVPTREFLERNFATVKDHLYSLSARVKSAIKNRGDA
jgi:hypothetical protein